MSDFTDYLEQQIRDWMSQGTDMPTAPTELWVGLHSADPGDTLDGSTEIDASDYTRASTATGTDWDSGTNPTQFSNSSEISFGQATNSWGTVSHVSLWDGSATSNNDLAAYGLNSNKTITTDDEAIFSAGDLSFEIQ